jgi:hypothetical protein
MSVVKIPIVRGGGAAVGHRLAGAPGYSGG